MQSQVGNIKRILIANRGEIACRIIRTARRMNIETLAIYSGADKDAMHVRMADRAHQVGEHPEPQKSYLNQDRILELAQRHRADAIHPGYGFLSENAEFSQRCRDERVVFIGPLPSSIKTMGIKNESKRIMIKAGVPVVPGYHGDNQEDELLLEEAQKIGYPVLIKPVRGGGGKGMRVVKEAANFLSELESSRRESLKSFNDQSMLLEKYIEKPRHVEVQVFGDTHGNHVYLYERDCSVQRRHQKIIEEAPAPLLSEKKRRELGEQAVAAAKAVDYVGAGTVEFILDKKTGEFYFMEMNTRLQVEHPITEMITGTDLVEWQLRVASGEQLPRQQHDIAINGHAFEARIYAESPRDNFLPQTGQLRYIALPESLTATSQIDQSASQIRLDTGVTTGDHISPYYDPMIAKLIVWGPDRQAALDKLSRALRGCVILGLPTNVGFLSQLATNKSFQAADVGTDFIDLHMSDLFPGQNTNLTSLDDKSEIIAGMGAFIYSILSQSGFSRHSLRMGTGGFQDQNLNSFRMIGQKKPVYEFSRLRMEETLPNVDFNVKYQSLAHDSGSLSIFLNDQTEPFYEGHQTFVHDGDGHVRVLLDGGQESYKFAIESPILLIDGETTLIIRNSSGLCQPVKSRVENYLERQRRDSSQVDSTNPLLACAPMPGIIEKILVERGDPVKAGQSLVILSAMKMEYTIKSSIEGRVADIRSKLGSFVTKDSTLIILESLEDQSTAAEDNQ